MATISQLAALIAERCGRPKDAPVFIRRGREAGYLPDSLPGRSGLKPSSSATTEDAVVLLLAMMQAGREPKAALAAVETWAAFEAAEVAIYALTDRPGIWGDFLGYGDEAALAQTGNCATSLASIINCFRRQQITVLPREVSIGRYLGTERATLQVEHRDHGIAPIGVRYLFLAPGWRSSAVPASADETLCSIHSVGGGILRAIGELLGPLAMTGEAGPWVGSLAAGQSPAMWSN